MCRNANPAFFRFPNKTYIPLDDLREQYKAWGKYDPAVNVADLIEENQFPAYIVNDVANGNVLR